MQKKFKVVCSKKDSVISLCCLCFFEIVLIVMIVTENHVLLDTILALCLLTLILGNTLSTFLFCVEVNNATINVRTGFGRRYKFHCSDIEKVICSRRDSIKSGPIHYLDIQIKEHELRTDVTMVGFDTLAGYILEKLETGEIKHTAVSESCKKMLRKYKNGDFHSKKK